MKQFNFLNTYFDHIYLITLKGSTDRHARFEEVLEGLNYEIFWGIDGNKLNLEEIQQQGLYDAELAKTKIPIGRTLTHGEIGCAMSHLAVYKDILMNGYRNAFILEDDIGIIPEAIPDLPKSLAELPNDWDLVYLGYKLNNSEVRLPILLRIYLAYPILNMIGITKYNSRKLRCMFPREYSEHLQLSGYHYGAHAYAVTASGAKKIISFQKPISMAADNTIGMMCREEAINAFRIKKRVFCQSKKLPTTIKGRYDFVTLEG